MLKTTLLPFRLCFQMLACSHLGFFYSYKNIEWRTGVFLMIYLLAVSFLIKVNLFLYIFWSFSCEISPFLPKSSFCNTEKKNFLIFTFYFLTRSEHTHFNTSALRTIFTLKSQINTKSRLSFEKKNSSWHVRAISDTAFRLCPWTLKATATIVLNVLQRKHWNWTF